MKELEYWGTLIPCYRCLLEQCLYSSLRCDLANWSIGIFSLAVSIHTGELQWLITGNVRRELEITSCKVILL